MKLNHTMPDFNPSTWAPSPERLELTDNEIHVWRAYLDCEETVLHQFEATLSSDEQARATRFSFRRDRNVFIVTRGILRELLGRYVTCSPVDVEFEYNPRGKPCLRAKSVALPVEFNVSHSRGVALLAFSVGRQVGIDLEFMQPDQATDEVAERYFSPREIVELHTLPLSLRAEGFFLCWTRKEAYIKARGEGLVIPFESFSVGLTPGQTEWLESVDSCRWSLHTLQPDPAFAGALVGEGTGWRVRCWDWNAQAAADLHKSESDSI
jgi:4'-phosphopantetheinyl transferase